MGFLVKAVTSVVKAVVGIVSKVVGGVFGFLVGGSKKTAAKTKSVSSLNKSLDPEAYRKIAFGRISCALDVRYWEVYGTGGNQFDEVIAACCHQINAYKELYLENDLAIDAAGTVQTKFAGVLTRDTRVGAPGQTAMSVGSGTQWTAGATFDGVAHFKLAWVPDDKKLPSGIPSRYTQVIEAALVYDPRRDSTVPGGSGSHRITDRTTWAYATLDGNGVPIGRNNALQALWYLLGWYVPTKDAGGTVTGSALVAGRGVDPQDINLATFIAGANNCEAAGYYTDMLLSTEDSHTSNEDKITCNGLIGRLIDPGGLWSYYANVNDTANVAVVLTDADVLQGTSLEWEEYQGMSDQYNQVSGKYINPSATTLFQPFPYPMVRDATYEANLGVKRRKPQDFEQVLDGTLAQRLARLLLNEGQYQGELSNAWNYRAVKAQAWSVVRYDSERFGWSKLFRVWRQDIDTMKGVSMLLKEIDPSIWSAGTVNSPVAPGTGARYNATKQIPVTGLAAVAYTLTGTGTNPSIADGAIVSWDVPPIDVRRTEIRYRIVGTTYWESLPPVIRGAAALGVIVPMVSGAVYEINARHISVNEIEGAWVVLAGNFTVGTNGNITYAGIVDASGKAIWSNVTGSGKPTDNADVTAANVALGIYGQGPGATANSAQVLNNSTLGNMLRVPAPVGGELAEEGSPLPGAVAILLPSGFTDTMVRFNIEIYEYGTSASATYSVGGYMYSGGGGTWLNTFASYVGADAMRRPVRFGRQTGTGRPVIWLGDPGTAWSYPKIRITNFIAGYSNYTEAAWATGWNVLRDTGAATNVTAGPLTPHAGEVVFGLNALEAPGGAVATLANFKTFLGIAAGITGQAATATNSDFAAVTGSGKPADNAGTSGFLLPIGSYTVIRGNSTAKYGGTHGSIQGAAVGSGQQGGAYITGSIISAPYGGGWVTYFALDDNPGTYSTVQKIVGRCVASPVGYGTFVITTNGIDQAGSVNMPIDQTTRWRVVSDNTNCWIEVDGVPVTAKVPAPPMAKIFPKVIDYFNNGPSGDSNSAYYVKDILYGSFADITAQQQVTVTPTLTTKDISSNSSGTVNTGVLPAPIAAPKVVRGGTDITTDNSTSHVLQNIAGGCVGNVSVDNTNGSSTKGLTTVGTGFTSTGSYEHVVSVDGKAQPAIKVIVNLARAAPTSGGGGGGGGGSGNTGSAGSGPMDNGTGLVETLRISGIVVASGKTARCSFADDYVISNLSNANATRTGTGHWEYSVAGANSWSALGSNVNAGSSAQYFWVSGDQNPGSLVVNQNVAPSAGTYDFRFMSGLTAAFATGNAYFNGGGGGSVDATT